MEFENGAQRTDGIREGRIGLIRTPVISLAASPAQGGRRAQLMVRMQQELSRNASPWCWTDGTSAPRCCRRDVKVYLTASPEVRARRRWGGADPKGQQADLNQVLSDVIAGPLQDSTRAIDPVSAPRRTPVSIDTTHLSRQLVVQAVLTQLEPGYEGNSEKPNRFSWLYAFVVLLGVLYIPPRFAVRYHNLERAKLDAQYFFIANTFHA